METQRVQPFKENPKRAKDSTYRNGDNIWQLLDANAKQVYAGDVFHYTTKRTERHTMVCIKSLYGRHRFRSIPVIECDKHGAAKEGAITFKINPAYLGLHWQRLSARDLANPDASIAERLEESAKKIHKKRAQRQKALNKAKSIKDDIAPSTTNERLEQICNKHNYRDLNRARQIRDDKIATLIDPATSDKALRQLSEMYPMSLTAMKIIRSRKQKSCSGY